MLQTFKHDLDMSDVNDDMSTLSIVNCEDDIDNNPSKDEDEDDEDDDYVEDVEDDDYLENDNYVEKDEDAFGSEEEVEEGELELVL